MEREQSAATEGVFPGTPASRLREAIVVIAVLGAVAMLLLGACGGEDSRGNATATTAPTEAPPATTGGEPGAARTPDRTRATPSPEPQPTETASATPTPAATSTPRQATPASEPQPTPHPEPLAACAEGSAVSDPERLPGLVQDCATLLKARETLGGGGVFLNWSADRPMEQWRGITLATLPIRVSHISLDCCLRGEIPGVLAELEWLVELALSDTMLSGGIPRELGSLPHLQVLDLSRNQLTGEIPPELANLSNLRELHLDGNQLTGDIPEALAGIPNLTSLSLGDNKLGCIPVPVVRKLSESAKGEGGARSPSEPPICPPRDYAEAVDACTAGGAVGAPEENAGLVQDCATLLAALEVLIGADAEVDGEPLPNWSAGLPIHSWRGVTVEGNRVTGLSWYQPELRGQIPGVLGDLSELRYLNLSAELTGGIPPELGKLGNLRELWLWGNALTGEIPSELGRLSRLEDLRLSGNQLTGDIPPELGQLGNLEYLHLSGNQLTGDIPPELGQLGNLEYFRLSGNQLNGNLPPELGMLSSLRDLDLSDNRLTGELPAELSTLSLSTLDLRNNNLSGSIPPEFGGIPYLWTVSMYLSGNELTGCIPLEVGTALRDRHSLGMSYCQCPATWERSSWGEPEFAYGDDGIPYMPHGSTERAGTYRITFSLILDLPPGGDFSLDEMTRTDTGRIVVDIDEEKSWSSLTIDPFTGEELARSVVEGPSACTVTIGGLFDQIVASARAKPLEIPAQPNGLQTMYRLQPVEGGRSYYLGYSNYLVVDVPEGMTLTLEDASLVCADPGGCWQWLELRDETSGSFIFVANDNGFARPATIVEDDTGRDLDALFDSLVASIRRVPPPYYEASCDTPPTADDCAVLLEAKETLAKDGALNWGADTSIWHWDGVGVNPWTGRVVELDLTFDELSGRIPPVLGQLSALEVLKLYDNDLMGRIPPELGRLASLRELDLGENPLRGDIPPELGSLTNLVELSLYSTELTGGIPPELGRLTNLRKLSIVYTPLGGEIPPELGSLLNLVELRLHTVGLVGEIPEELGQLSLLEDLSLYGNYLEGCIPETLHSFDFIIHSSSNPELGWCEKDQ